MIKLIKLIFLACCLSLFGIVALAVLIGNVQPSKQTASETTAVAPAPTATPSVNFYELLDQASNDLKRSLEKSREEDKKQWREYMQKHAADAKPTPAPEMTPDEDLSNHWSSHGHEGSQR